MRLKTFMGGSLRVLGAFATRQEAQACIDAWALEEPSLETRVTPFHSWRILSKHPMDLDAQKEAFFKQLEAYSKSREEAFEQVRQRVENKAESKAAPEPVVTAPDVAVAVASEPVAVVESRPATISTSQSVPEKLQVPNQQQVGLAVLPDILAEQANKPLAEHEPAFEFLCIANHESEIENFFQKWSTKYIVDEAQDAGILSSVPLACVDMYQFVRPALVVNVPTRHVSRDERLQKIKDSLSQQTWLNKDDNCGEPCHSGVEGVANQEAQPERTDANE